VAAVSANDIWAVGDYAFALRKYKNENTWAFSPYRVTTLTEHWNGTRWAVGPSVPLSVHPGNDPNGENPSLLGLTAVTAAPSGDVLALATNYVQHPLWRFNGSAWTLARHARPTERSAYVPRPNYMTYPGAAVITDHGDAWLFGSNAFLRLLATHWDGNHWSQARLPSHPSQGIAKAASASPTGDIWVAGRFGSGAHALTFPLLHYTC
jgi:hypothetical protein